MTSYIVFDSPPSISECRASWSDHSPSPAHWSTVTVPLSSSQTTSSATQSSDLVIPDSHEFSRYADADTTANSSRGAIRAASNLYAGALQYDDDDDDDDDDERSRNFTSRDYGRSIIEGSQRLLIHPPPTQSKARNESFYATQLTLDYAGQTQNTSAFDSQSNDASFIGQPPRFPWNPSSLSPLNHLRALCPASGRGPTVSVLAAVLDIETPWETKSGKTMAKLELVDQNNAILTLVMWEDVAENWCDHIRRGDIVYLDSIVLKLNDNKLEASTCRTSALQICYRTICLQPEDDDYTFHSRHEDFSAASRTVLALATWYTKTYHRH
ncbi:Nucleic acid-binding, OB-fold-like domain protein [Pseudohyphozyma bogoriensis]|nr:Nucleic acid-binding, OB-fold-like domain protein [Pseudohyphozyma bogoriensis]